MVDLLEKVQSDLVRQGPVVAAAEQLEIARLGRVGMVHLVGMEEQEEEPVPLRSIQVRACSTSWPKRSVSSTRLSGPESRGLALT